jgi:hypothetical protein
MLDLGSNTCSPRPSCAVEGKAAKVESAAKGGKRAMALGEAMAMEAEAYTRPLLTST